MWPLWLTLWTLHIAAGMALPMNPVHSNTLFSRQLNAVKQGLRWGSVLGTATGAFGGSIVGPLGMVIGASEGGAVGAAGGAAIYGGLANLARIVKVSRGDLLSECQDRGTSDEASDIGARVVARGAGGVIPEAVAGGAWGSAAGEETYGPVGAIVGGIGGAVVQGITTGLSTSTLGAGITALEHRLDPHALSGPWYC